MYLPASESLAVSPVLNPTVPKAETVASLSGLLRYKGIVNIGKNALLEALALFAKKNIDLVDCIVIAKARQEALEEINKLKAEWEREKAAMPLCKRCVTFS